MCLSIFLGVSMQLVFPASGKGDTSMLDNMADRVSIQLVFPASGKVTSMGATPSYISVSFHSISFPSEWERAESKIPSRREF